MGATQYTMYELQSALVRVREENTHLQAQVTELQRRLDVSEKQADGLLDTGLAHCDKIDALRAQVAELQALSVTRILIDVVPGDGSGQEMYAKSVADVVNKLSELADLADSRQAQVAAWVAAASYTGLLLPDADGMPRQTASAISLKAQVDALAGALIAIRAECAAFIEAKPARGPDWVVVTVDAALAAAGR